MEKYEKNCEKRLWSETADIPDFNQLHGDAKTDVLIIGGGAAGLLCGYYLKKRNADYMILEGRRILSGTTGLTTAKITAQHGLIYSKMIKNAGLNCACMGNLTAPAVLKGRGRLTSTLAGKPNLLTASASRFNVSLLFVPLYSPSVK